MNNSTPPSGGAPRPMLLNNTKQRARKKRRKHLRSVLALLFFAAALLLIIFKDDIDFAEIRLILTGQSTAFAIAAHEGMTLDIVFDMSGNSMAATYKNNLLLANSRKVAVFRSDGSPASEFDVAMQNPCIISGKRYFLTYDRGGNTLYIANSISKILKIQTEFPIITASINDKGEFAYVTGSKAYKTELYVYDASMHLAYEWYSQSAHINNIAISPKGDKVAMSGITTEESNLTTVFKILDIRKGEVQDEQILADEIVLQTNWQDDELMMITDKKISLYDTNTHTVSITNDFIASELSILKISADPRYVFVFNDFVQGKGGRLEVYNDRATSIATVELEKTPIQVHVNNGKIVVIYANFAEIYSKNGILLNEIPEKIFRTACINAAEHIYFVGIDNIYVYS